MTRDNLIDLITIGLARTRVKQEGGEKVDEAAIIADVLTDNHYSNSPEIVRELFKDIDYILLMMFEEYASLGYKEYCAIIENVHHKFRPLKRKYTEENYNDKD